MLALHLHQRLKSLHNPLLITLSNPPSGPGFHSSEQPMADWGFNTGIESCHHHRRSTIYSALTDSHLRKKTTLLVKVVKALF
ncbi:hypothetical protein HanRHA438_Chr03g0142601 [Helianthus annuus]|uniref:Uncharacterized protein n=1 Tax=Helianthus annuus TaxID=4232 RepID=A0A251VA18_HELAN|nr:hypothetical protein HanXRQr2_Chr03g0131341 [Helianthus annuus]KAJ0602703.1 hypothetical protein HanIR_Chr03g0142671 [Helianthus annuus]KAJ0609541.1 hypothetical protein HanHA89_Chr03g0121121 [Helianthus annuus]KAJ0769589.1 hypothetical protein HanLR1_Chr03g0114441 [Helianthus annuus]KAJ0775316.1 hypothetical protein HanOQP8_Chr03g0121601 [Helianthus annuus]